MKQDVLLRIIGIIARHGAEIAFPTSTVHLAGGGAGRGAVTVRDGARKDEA